MMTDNEWQDRDEVATWVKLVLSCVPKDERRNLVEKALDELNIEEVACEGDDRKITALSNSLMNRIIDTLFSDRKDVK